MYPRSDLRIRIGMLAVAAALAVARPGRADDLAAYLERNGLDQLLAIHLAQQLAEVTGEERGELVLRLADLYARLLEVTTDETRRAWLEARSQDLLSEAPPAGADELRLALLRGTYRTAERLAEQHRMRNASEGDVARASELFAGMIPKLTRLQATIDANTSAISNRLRRASGRAAGALASELEKSRRLGMQCMFVTAWSLYYQAWLEGRSEPASQAQLLFGRIIDPGNPTLRPGDVSVDLRAQEAMARSILGMALAKSLTAQVGTAIAWVDLLAHRSTHPALRDDVEVWRDAIYLDRGEFVPILRRLEEWDADRTSEPTLAWLRLAAVYALEDDRGGRTATEVVQRAVTALAARGELGQVLDLARRYGIERLGASGFAVEYVRGVLTYHQTRELHGGDTPTTAPALVAAYRQAAGELEAARAEPDATSYASASAACTRLVGWCHYFSSQFTLARRAFEEASSAPGAVEPADSLWMAIVCLDKVLQGGDDTVASELAALIDRFLEEFPASEHASKLVLKQAYAAREITPELIDELLAIPPTSDSYDAARSRAAQLLYRMFRDSEGDRKLAWAGRYISVALPLLAAGSGPGALDVAALQVRCRRILEVSLTRGVERLVAARTALDAFAAAHEADPEGLAEFVDEIDYRAVVYQLASGDVFAAAALADRLWLDDPDVIWARLAARAMFRDGYERWRQEPEGLIDDRSALASVVKYGRRVLREYEGRPDALTATNVASWYLAVAEAAARMWERTRDAEVGAYALGLFRDVLLPARPNDAKLLRYAGLLGEGCGDRELALASWRRLVAGSSVGSDAWYEARYHVVAMLADDDPQRARAVLDQHLHLHPGYGPPPWGERLRELDQRLGRRQDAGEDAG